MNKAPRPSLNLSKSFGTSGRISLIVAWMKEIMMYSISYDNAVFSLHIHVIFDLFCYILLKSHSIKKNPLTYNIAIALNV